MFKLYEVTINKNYEVVSRDNLVMTDTFENIMEYLEELDAYQFDHMIMLWIAGSKGEKKLQVVYED